MTGATDWRLYWALAEWAEAERFRAIAAKTERMFRPSCYTLTWRAREARARKRLRHAVIMNECGGMDGYADTSRLSAQAQGGGE